MAVDALNSSPFVKSVTSLDSPFDVTGQSDGGGRVLGICRAVRCEEAGYLNVKLPDGTAEVLRFKAGETRAVQCSKITSVASGTCLPLEVLW